MGGASPRHSVGENLFGLFVTLRGIAGPSVFSDPRPGRCLGAGNVALVVFPALFSQLGHWWSAQGPCGSYPGTGEGFIGAILLLRVEWPPRAARRHPEALSRVPHRACAQ